MNLYRILFEERESESMVRLFHFSKHAKTDKVILDPKFIGKNPETRNDMNVSNVPRVMFYTNVEHREPQFETNTTLYSVLVPESKIYDLKADPEGLKLKYVLPSGRPGLHEILKVLSGWEFVKQNKWDIKGNWVKNNSNYSGVSYSSGGLDIVNWFDPIEVSRYNNFEDEEPTENQYRNTTDSISF